MLNSFLVLCAIYIFSFVKFCRNFYTYLCKFYVNLQINLYNFSVNYVNYTYFCPLKNWVVLLLLNCKKSLHIDPKGFYFLERCMFCEYISGLFI